MSDHKPEDEESKRLTFAQAATGASGIETLLSLSLELYHNGSLKLLAIYYVDDDWVIYCHISRKSN